MRWDELVQGDVFYSAGSGVYLVLEAGFLHKTGSWSVQCFHLEKGMRCSLFVGPNEEIATRWAVLQKERE